MTVLVSIHPDKLVLIEYTYLSCADGTLHGREGATAILRMASAKEARHTVNDGAESGKVASSIYNLDNFIFCDMS